MSSAGNKKFSDALLDKPQKLQNRAAKIVTNSLYNVSALPIIRKLGWQTVNDLIVEETFKIVYKCTNCEVPSYLACLFGRLSEIGTRELRNKIQDRNNKVKVVKSSRSAGIKMVPLCSGVLETGFKLFETFC